MVRARTSLTPEATYVEQSMLGHSPKKSAKVSRRWNGTRHHLPLFARRWRADRPGAQGVCTRRRRHQVQSREPGDRLWLGVAFPGTDLTVSRRTVSSCSPSSL
jgi:hypothetical protein